MQSQGAWSTVQFETQQENEELAGWVLMQDFGATGCEVKEIGNSRVMIQATFEKEAISVNETHQIAETLMQYGLIQKASNLNVAAVPNRDWFEKFRAEFKPFPVGELFMICPVWDEESAKAAEHEHRIVIRLEPGMAFGTGLHATTRYCLRQIEKLELGPRVLDMGTGSGILAIAAALKNSQLKLIAIDNDPVATQVAEETCKMNDVQDRVELHTGSAELVEGRQFDHVLSNLTAEVIIEMLPYYERLVVRGGKVICAGILGTKAETVEKAAAEHGFKCADREDDPTWTGMVLERI